MSLDLSKLATKSVFQKIVNKLNDFFSKDIERAKGKISRFKINSTAVDERDSYILCRIPKNSCQKINIKGVIETNYACLYVDFIFGHNCEYSVKSKPVKYLVKDTEGTVNESSGDSLQKYKQWCSGEVIFYELPYAGHFQQYDTMVEKNIPVEKMESSSGGEGYYDLVYAKYGTKGANPYFIDFHLAEDADSQFLVLRISDYDLQYYTQTDDSGDLVYQKHMYYQCDLKMEVLNYDPDNPAELYHDNVTPVKSALQTGMIATSSYGNCQWSFQDYVEQRYYLIEGEEYEGGNLLVYDENDNLVDVNTLQSTFSVEQPIAFASSDNVNSKSDLYVFHQFDYNNNTVLTNFIKGDINGDEIAECHEKRYVYPGYPEYIKPSFKLYPTANDTTIIPTLMGCMGIRNINYRGLPLERSQLNLNTEGTVVVSKFRKDPAIYQYYLFPAYYVHLRPYPSTDYKSRYTTLYDYKKIKAL